MARSARTERLVVPPMFSSSPLGHDRLWRNATRNKIFAYKWCPSCSSSQSSRSGSVSFYSMPNPVYTYTLDIYITCKHILLITFLNKLELFNWFQVLLYNSHNLLLVIFGHSNWSIWSIDRTLSGITSSNRSGPGSKGNEEVFHLPQISKGGASQSEGLLSNPGHWLWGRGLTSLLRCSRCFLQLQPTELSKQFGSMQQTKWLEAIDKNKNWRQEKIQTTKKKRTIEGLGANVPRSIEEIPRNKSITDNLKPEMGIVRIRAIIFQKIYLTPDWTLTDVLPNFQRLFLCRGVKLPQRISWLWHKTVWLLGSSNDEALGNAKYSFIAIVLRSTLARSGSTW